MQDNRNVSPDIYAEQRYREGKFYCDICGDQYPMSHQRRMFGGLRVGVKCCFEPDGSSEWRDVKRGLAGKWAANKSAEEQIPPRAPDGSIYAGTRGVPEFAAITSHDGPVVLTVPSLNLVAASSQYVDCGGAAMLKTNGDFSVSTWILLTTADSTFGFAGNIVNGSGGFFLALGINLGSPFAALRLEGFTGSDFFFSSSLLATRTWTHVAAVRSGATVTIYINGLANGVTQTITIPTQPSATNYMLGKAGNQSAYFYGRLADERFYDAALSAADILNVYNGAATVTQPKGWWKLNDGSGLSAADSSGNGNTGTLTNGPTWITGSSSGVLHVLGFGFTATDTFSTGYAALDAAITPTLISSAQWNLSVSFANFLRPGKYPLIFTGADGLPTIWQGVFEVR